VVFGDFWVLFLSFPPLLFAAIISVAMEAQLLFQCFVKISSGVGSERMEAEQVVAAMRSNPQFPLLLLAILVDPQTQIPHRQI